MFGVRGLLVLLLLIVSSTGSARADAAGQSGLVLDIEFAFDGTASMAPTIAQAQKDAESIMYAVRQLDPDARFAVVAFRDPNYAAPEYEVLRRLTGDVRAVRAAIGRVKSAGSLGPVNLVSEAYNLAFQRSVTDDSLGWRPSSRKVVVVLGDAEPHGAGAVGVRGCRDTAPDPHGLKTTDVLQQMRNAGRTLVMIRQRGLGQADLDCYAGLAALAAPGGAARDSGSAGLVTPVVSLIKGTLTSLTVDAGPGFALSGEPIYVRVLVANNSRASTTVNTLTLQLPSGTSFMSAKGGRSALAVSGRVVTWNQRRTLPPGAAITVLVRVATVKKEGRLSFVATAASVLAEGETVVVSANARVRVGRSLGIRLVATTPRSPVGGALSLMYSASARTLAGRTVARGTVTLGRTAASALVVRLTSARVLGTGSNATVVLTGTVHRSRRGTCRSGTPVTLRLVDRDFRRPRTRPDVIALEGAGCNGRFAADARTE